MTWLEFKNAVKEFITVDAVRLNTQTLVEKLARQAVIDLQGFVEEMRFPHQTPYYPSDLSDDGFASFGMLPDQAIPRDMYYVKDNDIPGEVNNECARSPIEEYPYDNRYDLICGNVPIVGCQYKIAMSWQATNFYVFPKLAEGHHLSLFWEGQRLDFEDQTIVPFGERSVMAAAMFVKAGIIREVDKDPGLALSYMGVQPHPLPGTYLYLRRLCHLDGRDRKRFASSKPSPSAQSNCANTTLCATTPTMLVA